MEYVMFYLAVVAAFLLWSAMFVAAAARTERAWLQRSLAAVALLVPPLALLPWVVLTAVLAFWLGLGTNWFAPTLTAFLAVLVGGTWIARAGRSRTPAGQAAEAWPVAGLAVMFVMAKLVSAGMLLFIDHTVTSQVWPLRAEAAEIVRVQLPPPPPADDDAAPLVLRALAALRADKDLAAAESPLVKPVSADVSTANITTILSRHADTVDLLRRAADKPGCRFVRDWARPSIAMKMPELMDTRQAARLLAIAARRAGVEGDAAAALRDVVRIHRLGNHVASEPALICGLIGRAIDETAVETLVSLLPNLGPQDLPLLDGVGVRDFLATPMWFHRHCVGEEAIGLSMLADLSDDTLSLDLVDWVGAVEVAALGPIVNRPLCLLYRCFLLRGDLAGYRDIMRRFQDLAAETTLASSARPFPETEGRFDEIETELRERRPGLFGSLMAPAIPAALASQTRSQALHRSAEVLVAATRVRLATGSLPAAAADLVPVRMATLPQDPFAVDAPLTWKRADGAIVVYSVGRNGQDDGGPPAPGEEPPQGNDDLGLRLPLAAGKSP